MKMAAAAALIAAYRSRFGWIVFASTICWLMLPVVSARAQSKTNVVNLGPGEPPTFGFVWPCQIQDTLDASLTDITASTTDRFWAVGRRGLILRSDDAGRHWRPVHLPHSLSCERIAFADARRGWIVGGCVEPGSSDSLGRIWTTEDGGEHWIASDDAGLARLTGFQFTGDAMIAWGDWSPRLQSAIAISRDGGRTFSRIPVPCGGVQTSAWLDSRRGVVVDQLSRVLVVREGDAVEQVDLPCSPLMPIRSACVSGQYVWLVGAGGQIYRSSDLSHWQSIPLPAPQGQIVAAPESTLTCIADDRAGGVLVGSAAPGTLYRVHADSSVTVLRSEAHFAARCVYASQPTHLLAGGPMAEIVESRNNGAGWWTLNRACDQADLLIIAPTAQDIAWDMAIHASLGPRRSTAICVMHEQDLLRRSDVVAAPEVLTQQAADAANCLLEMWSGFPISGVIDGDLNVNDRMVYSAATASGQTEIDVRLVDALRQYRPNVIVFCDRGGSELHEKAKQAVLRAVRVVETGGSGAVAGQSESAYTSSFHPRLLRRTPRSSERSLADWSLAPDSLLGGTGALLAHRMQFVQLLVHERLQTAFPIQPKVAADTRLTQVAWRDVADYGDYWLFGSQRRTASQSGSVFDGLLTTGRPADRTLDGKGQSAHFVMATLQQQRLIDQYLERLEDTTNEDLNELFAAVGAMNPADRDRVLLEVAVVALTRGEVDVWLRCCQQIFEGRQRNASSLATWRSAVPLATSTELQFAASKFGRRSRSQALGSVTGLSSVRTAEFTSPFAAGGEETAAVSTVQTAANVAPRLGDNDLLGRERVADLFRYADVAKLTRPGQTVMRLSLAADANRTAFRCGDVIPAAPSLVGESFWTIDSVAGLAGWPRLAAAERSAKDRVAPSPIRSPHVLKVSQLSDVSVRPHLDGQIDDACWAGDPDGLLEPVMPSDGLQPTRVWLRSDPEFLLLAMEGPAGPSEDDSGPTVAEKSRRDVAEVRRDHLEIWIDCDRDYQTGYRFIVDQKGNTAEFVNQLAWYDPRWYVASSRDGDTYRCEIAIPLDQLVDADFDNRLWAIQIRRRIAGDVVAWRNLPCDTPLASAVQLIDLE